MITDEKEGPLQAMELRDFVLAVGARTPAPGGGAVAALVASLVRTAAVTSCCDVML